MKKNKFKRVLSIALATVMVAGTIAFTPQGASEVQAAPTAKVKNINLGTVGFSAPTSTESNATSWAGSKVYYGDKLWRVLDPSHDSNGAEGSAFLFSEELQGTKAYNSEYVSVTWETCTLRKYLNGTDNGGGTGTFLGDTFTAEEQSAINTTTVQNPNNSDYNTNGGYSTKDKLFLLSLEEVKKANYGFGSNNARAVSSASSEWWLRSPGYYDGNAALVDDGGDVSSYGRVVDDTNGSVRPAFNLNLSSVLFSSASSAGKSSFAKVGEDQVSANIWKLTLKDSSKTVSVTSGESVTHSGQTVTVPYTYTGNDVSQISIMITDKAYTESDASILYYGALTTTLNDTKAGTGTFELPTSLPDGYKIYMMAEDVNGDTLTDYSSEPVEIIPVTTYDVTVNNGTGDGSYVAGATVTITADEAPSGQEFDKWTVVSGGITLASATSVTTTFEMPANAVEVTAAYKNKPSDPNPPTPTPTYTITAGAGGTHQLNTEGTLSITCDGALNKLTGIYVDDKLVDEANYTLVSGSTILTLKAEYLNTLSVGTHKVKFQYTDGSAETTLVIKAADTDAEQDENTAPAASTPDVKVTYRTHVQKDGWQNAVADGKVSGTLGESKRLEGININVTGNSKLGIQYSTHVQSYGWMPWSSNGEMSGTEGEAKRLEAIKIQLTGSDKDKYDIYYRVHAQSYGWLDWAKNGEATGTAGLSKRLEAIQIVVVKKGESIDTNMEGIKSAETKPYVTGNGATENPVISGANETSVEYRTHVQTYGWQMWKYNGTTAGTTGQAKRLEGINIRLANQQYAGGIEYQSHVQTYGWEKTWRKNGETSGTSGQAKRLEAIRIRLTGEMAQHYDIYYRVHSQTYGWLGWAKNGEAAGTEGHAKRLEGIQIVLVKKGEAAPGSTAHAFIK